LRLASAHVAQENVPHFNANRFPTDRLALNFNVLSATRVVKNPVKYISRYRAAAQRAFHPRCAQIGLMRLRRVDE